MKKRTRPPGLSVLHREQIEGSKSRIVAAAAAAFAQSSYRETSVEEIIEIAGISSATFYKYFKNKLDVASELIKFFAPKVETVADELPGQATPDEVREWVSRVLEFHEQNRQFIVLLSEVMSFEPAFSPAIIAGYDNIIDRVGPRIPAFGKAASGLPENMHIRAIARLRLQHIFTFCLNVVLMGWVADVEPGIDCLADDLTRFITEYK